MGGVAPEFFLLWRSAFTEVLTMAWPPPESNINQPNVYLGGGETAPPLPAPAAWKMRPLKVSGHLRMLRCRVLLHESSPCRAGM